MIVDIHWINQGVPIYYHLQIGELDLQIGELPKLVNMINFVGPVVPPSTDPNNYQPSMIDWLRLCGQMAHNCLGTVCIADVDSVSFGLKLPISALSTTNTWAEFRCVFFWPKGCKELWCRGSMWIWYTILGIEWLQSEKGWEGFHYMKVRSRNAITLYIYHWIFLEIIYDHICICLFCLYASSLSSMKEDRHSKTSKLLAALLFGVSHPGRSLICDVATIKHLGMLTFGR